MARPQQSPPPASVLQRERKAAFYEEQRYIVRLPVPRYYAILVGLALTPLGIAGFIPQFTRGGLLFNVLRDSLIMSGIYLVTGIAGLVTGIVRKGHYAPLFTLIVTGIYLVLFSSGNIAFGNTAGATGGPPDLPWILENALHAGLMLTGALVTGLAALQYGDRATVREFKQRYGFPDPRAQRASAPLDITRGIDRALERLTPRWLSQPKMVLVGAAALLVLAVAALALYYIVFDVVE